MNVPETLTTVTNMPDVKTLLVPSPVLATLDGQEMASYATVSGGLKFIFAF